jgi:hypothetical protein
MADSPQPGRASALLAGLLFGGVFALTGGLILAVSLDLIHVNPENFKAPRLVVAAAGAVFFMAGIWIVFQAASPEAQDTRLYRWMQYFIMVAMLGAFAAIFLWVGFGPGARQFETSTSLGPVSAGGTASEFEGRCIFGGFGLLMALGVLYYAVTRPARILGRREPAPRGKRPGPHPPEE